MKRSQRLGSPTVYYAAVIVTHPRAEYSAAAKNNVAAE